VNPIEWRQREHRTLSVVEHHVEIADNVRIHTQVFIPEFSVLEGCWIGPNVVFTKVDPLSPGVKDQLAGPVIKRGAKIGRTRPFCLAWSSVKTLSSAPAPSSLTMCRQEPSLWVTRPG
jgi:hypothetical protein